MTDPVLLSMLDRPCTIISRSQTGAWDRYHNPTWVEDSETSTVWYVEQTEAREVTEGRTTGIATHLGVWPSGTVVDDSDKISLARRHVRGARPSVAGLGTGRRRVPYRSEREGGGVDGCLLRDESDAARADPGGPQYRSVDGGTRRTGCRAREGIRAGRVGDLKNSIRSDLVSGNVARISVNVSYWNFPEYGTSNPDYPTTPYLRPALSALGLNLT